LKSDLDVARGWLRKAESDLGNARLCLAAGESLDTACFHCQQAAEKSLKAYLIAKGQPFPFVHDLDKLLDHCVAVDAAFESLRAGALELNPFAVTMRYDEEFWPDASAVHQALARARAIFEFVRQRFVTAHELH
jgi:HEPN domain-containing protein